MHLLRRLFSRAWEVNEEAAIVEDTPRNTRDLVEVGRLRGEGEECHGGPNIARSDHPAEKKTHNFPNLLACELKE